MCTLFVGCEQEETYTITFMKLDSPTAKKFTEETTIQCEANSVIGDKAPLFKLNSYYVFAGWYTEEGCINTWNLYTDEVKSNITLYARFDKR